MTPNPYLSVPARIERVVDETPDIKTFSVRPDHPIPFRAGQFIAVAVPGLGEAPFTPSSSPAIHDRLEVTIMKAGRVTGRLHGLEAGAEVGVRGPFGTPYPLESYAGREVLIVGGGVGLAPLRALLFALFEDLSRYRNVIIRYGARTPRDIVYREAVMGAWGRGERLDVMVTVDRRDDGWTGNEGVVTTILDPSHLRCDPGDGVAVVCGPPIMMKFSTLALLERGYAAGRIFLSMEKNMSCGVGKCGHCRIGSGYACKDGPVFTYDQLRDVPDIFD